MSLEARLTFACLWSLLLLGFSGCSAHDSPVDAKPISSANGSAGSAGTPSGSGMSGSGGLGSKGAVGSAGTLSGGGGVFAQAGAFGASAAGGSGGNTGVNGGGSASGSSGSAGLAGNPSVSAAGSAGAHSSSAGSSGLGNVAGAAGSSAAFTQVSTVLGKNCGIKGCHGDKQAPLFAPGANLYATLTGPNTVLAACDYTKLVEPGDPSKSALVKLMNRKCGSFTMPPSCNQTPCISAADLKTLSDWISAGAPP